MEDILSRPYTREEFAEIRAHVQEPYQRALAAAINQARNRFGAAIVLSLHTFPLNRPGRLNTGRYAGAYVLGEEMARGSLKERTGLPDLIMISNGGLAAAPRVLEVIRSNFEDRGYKVEDGEGPLKGDHGTTAMYGRPREGVHVVGMEFVPHGIEIGRAKGRLDLDQEGAERTSGIFHMTFNRLSQLKPEEINEQ